MSHNEATEFHRELSKFDRVGFGMLMRRIEILLIRGLKPIALKALSNFADSPFSTDKFEDRGEEILKLIPDFDQDIDYYESLGRKAIALQPEQPTTLKIHPIIKDKPGMSSDLIASLERIMTSGEEGVRQIDEKIAEHHKQIVKLQSMRRILVGTGRIVDRKAGAMHSIDKEDRDSLREQIKTLIAEAGPMKASEIGERLGISYIAVGFILRDCKEIRRQGKHFHLA